MEEKIMEILTEVRPDVDFENEKSLIDDGVIESFDVIQIVTSLMDEFDIAIDADDIEPENFNSFEDICKLVQDKIADN
ncbi:MAG: acyl carrier protein [Lachnospiraceae bacterium]|nr:acyl carrier protein [Lachnospiraceae bacterium]